MRNTVGVLASFVTRSNSTCPKKFKERSPLILKNSVSTITRDPFRRPSRTIKGLSMEADAWKLVLGENEFMY